MRHPRLIASILRRERYPSYLFLVLIARCIAPKTPANGIGPAGDDVNSRDTSLYLAALALVGAIVLLGIGFASGTIARTHGGVVFPLMLLAGIAAVVPVSVYLVFAGWRTGTNWLARFVLSVPLSLILAIIAFFVYRIATM